MLLVHLRLWQAHPALHSQLQPPRRAALLAVLLAVPLAALLLGLARHR
jgi:hypothetical protein